MTTAYYACGKKVQKDDIFVNAHNTLYYRVVKVTNKRVYYQDCSDEGVTRWLYVDYTSHIRIAICFRLHKRLGPIIFDMKKSGFANFVQGCDTGKYGKKRRKSRVMKDNSEKGLTNEENSGIMTI
jgi:hypothetical protein